MEQGEIKIIMVTKETMHEQTVLKNLLKMYCYEWSQYNKFDVNTDGNFEFEKYASDYWTKHGYHAFLIAVHDTWAGFVLFDNDGLIVHKDYDYSMAEFFILYKYRCSGIGSHVANYIFDLFPGRWEIGCHPKNIGSVQFWDRVISKYSGGDYDVMLSCPEQMYHDGTLGNVVSFSGMKISEPSIANANY